MHPGANHLYIHAVEASPASREGAPVGHAPPDAGSHGRPPGAHARAHPDADGRLRRAPRSPTREAAEVDRTYFRATGKTGMYPVMYYDHNVHFESWAAAMAGRYAAGEEGRRPALRRRPARRLAGSDGRGISRAAAGRRRALPQVGRHPEDARSGRWAPDRARLLALRARRRGGRVGRRRGGAEGEGGLPGRARRRYPADRLFGPQNTVRHDAAGGAPRSGRSNRRTRAGIAPPRSRPGRRPSPRKTGSPTTSRAAWQIPMREALGAALLAAGQPAEAEKVFRADLERNPRNPRSLFGLAESLKAQGKDRRRGLGAGAVRDRLEARRHEARHRRSLSAMRSLAEISELYAYNRWANARTLEAARRLCLRRSSRAPSAAASRRSSGRSRTSSGAEWVWLERWHGGSPAGAARRLSRASRSVRGRLADVEAGQKASPRRPDAGAPRNEDHLRELRG